MLPYLKRLCASQVSLRAGAMLGVALLALFGLVEAGAWEVRQVRLKNRVRHALPKVREETNRELHVLTQAIDDYRNRLGCYPPDHLVSQTPVVVDAITNQLLYELLGTVYDRTHDTFTPTGHFPEISGVLVQKFFNVHAFKNSAPQRERVHQFIDLGSISGTWGVSQKPDVGVLAFWPSWQGIDPEVLQEIPLAPWRYNCSAPVHNPKSYDLWIEVPVADSKVVVGNW